MTCHMMRALAVAPLAFVLACNGVVELLPERHAPDAHVALDETGADARFEADGGDAAFDDTDPPIFEVGPSDAWHWDGYDPGDEYVATTNVCNRTTPSPHAKPGTRFCEIYRDIVHHDGSAKCQNYACHGGDHGWHGFSMGWTMEDCYASWTTFDTWMRPPDPERFVVPVPGGDSRGVSAIWHFLFTKPTPIMPLVDSLVHNRKLTTEEQQRVSDWLGRGAPFD